jgi:DNA-binding LacI/PurR family transcriptional regulator
MRSVTKKTVSLKALAEELNVSVPTVSRALKDHPDIGAELKERVWRLAKKQGYKIAQKEKNHTKTIGVIVPNVERSFYASIISGAEQYAKNEGYFLVVANSRESYMNEVECVENLIKLNVEGIIVCLSQQTLNYDHFSLAKTHNIPLVFFDRVCRTNEFSSVVADNAEAARTITNHLIEQGARNIFHVAGPKNLSITNERIAGFKQALLENNMPFSESLYEYCDLKPDSATKALQKLMKINPNPDAVFCVNDTVAFVVIKELKNMGLKVPADIAVTGFNNEFLSNYVEPLLTTIWHPTIDMGQETARLLLAQVNSDIPHAPRQIVMKTQLVVRDSSVKNKVI